MSLSNKIMYANRKNWADVIQVEDVKEFIEKVKAIIWNRDGMCINKFEIGEQIDKLAGEKLK